MKKIVLALLVGFMSRGAYAVPKGCFIAEYETSCHSAYFSSYDCDQYNMSSYYFGYYIKSMCDYVNSVESTSATCQNVLSVVVAQRDSANASLVTTQQNLATTEQNLATTQQNLNEWVRFAGTQNKLIKKLYKACGTKCRRIK